MNSEALPYLLLIVIAVTASLVIAIRSDVQMPISSNTGPISYKQTTYLTALTFSNITFNEKHLFMIQLANPFTNMSIRAYSFLSTDPANASQYVSLSMVPADGVLILPRQSLTEDYTVFVAQNSFEPSGIEYFIKIGYISS